MMGGFWHKLDQAGRNVAPLSTVLVLMLVGMVPLHLPGWGPVAPQLVLMALFYWAIHRPDLVRPSLAFLIGLLQDLLTGMPLGVNPLVYVLVYLVVLSQRRFFLIGSFGMLWLGFALIAAGASAVYWIAVCVLNMSLVQAGPAAAQAILTIALFPIFSWIFMRLHRAFLLEA
ncbi:rod shape-determining protein MreD [Arenibaculum pallidiluteum]|uniref:rod shape-determining protein MreD n=1 Tax=Arenibaculum pallidiluteum TaxID=2812559 RepID=UPI001A96C209|nr:rod shape-determining protein MreD [Arenibaculum pallidiluteum]